MKIRVYAVLLSPVQQPWNGPPTNLVKTGKMVADAAYEVRAKFLEDHVEKGFGALDAWRSRAGADDADNKDAPLYVFVGPEWLFRIKQEQRTLTFQPGQYFGKTHREKYEAMVARLSQRNNADVLLVAGSMLWIEPKDPLALLGLSRATEDYDRTRTAKYEGAGKPRSAGRVEREIGARDARRDILEERSTQPYLGYNEALVGYNGRIRKRVLKAANAGDFVDAEPDRAGGQVSMVFGLGAGVFSLDIGGGKLKVGLAICYDHSRVLGYDKTVDLYVLVSCSQRLAVENYVRDRGLILHADCRSSWSGAKKGSAGHPLDVDRKQPPYLLARGLIEIE